jgi:hypothetical protein
MNDLPIILRNIQPTDYGFILATYTKDLHRTFPFNHISNNLFFDRYTILLDKLITNSTVIVAHLDEEPDSLAAYLIAENTENSLIIHWAHTKGIFKRLGILKMMLNHFNYQDKLIVCTHMFDLYKKKKEDYSLIYDPMYLNKYLGDI